MFRIRMVIQLMLCVVAATAVFTSVAWAAGEWFQNKAVITENFALRTKIKATHPQFRGAKVKIECETSNLEGTIEPKNKLKKATIVFASCMSEAEGKACEVKSTNTATKELIETESLEGVLGVVEAKEATSLRGLELKPEGAKPFAEIEGKCLPGGAGTVLITEKITGNVIGEITPKTTETTKMKLKLEVEGGKQKIKEFEKVGGAHHLTAFGEELVFESEHEIIFEKKPCPFMQALEVT